MSRKGTIVIAVFVNAALLILLFVTALTSKDEVYPVPPSQMAEIEKEKTKEVSQRTEDLPFTPLEQTLSTLTERKEAAAPVVEPVKEEVVHKLPEIAQEKKEKPKQEIVAQRSLREITVQKGDSLERLAKKHSITVAEIIQINELPNTFLRVGQVLRIPYHEKETSVAKVEKELKANHVEGEYYTVKTGDNPWTIAMKHHIKVEDLLRLNDLNQKSAKRLKPGDKLRIR